MYSHTPEKRSSGLTLRNFEHLFHDTENCVF